MSVDCEHASSHDNRRSKILAVAREVVLTEGFSASFMSSIASRIGGSKGTLYRYFPSKADLFKAVVQKDCDLYEKVLFDHLDSAEEGIGAALKSFGQRYSGVVLSEDVIRLNRHVMAEAVRFPDLAKVLYDAGPQRIRARLADYIAGETRLGRLQCDDYSRAAYQFCQMCLGAQYRQRLMKLIAAVDPAEAKQDIDYAVQVFLATHGAK